MSSPRPVLRCAGAVALALTLGACGGSSDSPAAPSNPVLSMPPPPVTATVTGLYELIIRPAAGCGYPVQSLSLLVEAAPAGEPDRPEVRATLPGGGSNLVLELLYVAPGELRGSIATQTPLKLGNATTLFLRGVGTGRVALSADGRGEVPDGAMFGDVALVLNGVALGRCSALDHRWSLRAR